MSAFTRQEVEAELKRRTEAERQRDRDRAAAMRRAEADRANAICVHCGLPFIAYTAEAPLCDNCLYD
jgi:hypothetical protein